MKGFSIGIFLSVLMGTSLLPAWAGPAGISPLSIVGMSQGLPPGLMQALPEEILYNTPHPPFFDVFCDIQLEANCGWSTALDGNTAVVGAPFLDAGGTEGQGAAFIFQYDGTAWTQVQTLAPTIPAEGAGFGASVDISGNHIIVGAPGEMVGTNDYQGAAYIYQYDGSTWNQQARFTAPDGSSGDSYGYAVGITDQHALVGAPYQTVGANIDQGVVYPYFYDGTGWQGEPKMMGPDGGAHDYFGGSISLYANTALVGAFGDTVGINAGQGSVFVLTYGGARWNPQAQLTAQDGAAEDRFGFSVSLSGNTALVGAPYADVGTNMNQGLAYAFQYDGLTWEQLARVGGWHNPSMGGFGYATAFYGGYAVVGAPFTQVGANDSQGTAYVFAQTGTAWTQLAELNDPNGGSGDNFGRSVAISPDHILVGAPHRDAGTGTGQGAVYYWRVDELGGTFTDVRPTYWAYNYIEGLYAAGITTGCSSTPMKYCPEQDVSRAEMAVFIERGMFGGNYQPPTGTGQVFTDVPPSHWAVNWIEKFRTLGITTGCTATTYCPDDPVTRGQMAVFIIRAKYGPGYTPPPAMGVFSDVPLTYWSANYIEKLAADGITTGCGGGNYCPDGEVSRGQMAVFLVRAFVQP